jgi:hypothetical protein
VLIELPEEPCVIEAHPGPESIETLLVVEHALESSEIIAAGEPILEILSAKDQQVSTFLPISDIHFELF